MKPLVFGVLCSMGLAMATGAAAADAQLAAPIHQFVDSFNKGDLKAAAATHSADVAIIDEVAPYLWRGPGAFQAWSGALVADAQKRGLTDMSVALGEPVREEVSGDHGYVVMQATYSFKDHGAAMREPAQMTFALNKEAAGWRISGWTWSGPKPQPAK